jgi:hypothetical protein
MRRFAVAALLVTALVASGCSGADAQKAQALLDQTTLASANVKSISFSIRMWSSGAPDGADFVFLLHGGAYNKGKNKGDSFLTMSGLPGMGEISMATRHGHAYVKARGKWAEVPLPAGYQDPSAFAGFDLAAYVTDVRVEAGLVVEGEPMSRVTGTIDTSAAVKGLLSRLGAASGGSLPAEVTDSLGDMRAVLYISDVTHLPMRALVDLPIHVAGEKITMHMDMVVTAVNEPVSIPRF